MSAQPEATIRQRNVLTPKDSNQQATTEAAAPRKRKSRSLNVKELHPYANIFLVILMFLELVAVIYFYTREDIIFTAVAFILTAVGLQAVRQAFAKLGIFISSLTGNKRLAKSPRSVKKFADQGWQLFIHTTMSIWNLYLLAEVDFAWWNNTLTLYEDCSDTTPGHDHALSSCMEQAISPSVRYYYLVQLAIWGYTVFYHAFFDEVRKDYFAMFAHHLVTIGLIVSSYIFHYTRIGVVVLTIHDTSDIVMDVLKMVNYLNMEKTTIAIFLFNFGSWFYLRLYEFPFRIIRSTLLEGKQLAPRGKWWLESNALLIILLCLHIYWYGLLWKIALGLVMGKGTKKSSEEQYEGSATESDAD